MLRDEITFWWMPCPEPCDRHFFPGNCKFFSYAYGNLTVPYISISTLAVLYLSFVLHLLGGIWWGGGIMMVYIAHMY